MNRANLPKFEQVWILLVIVIGSIAFWQGTRNTPSAAASRPQAGSQPRIQLTATPLARSVQPQTIDVQVSTDADPAQVAKAVTGDQLDTGIYPLHDFYFYLDPGHNEVGTPPGTPAPSATPSSDCLDMGAPGGY